MRGLTRRRLMAVAAGSAPLLTMSGALTAKASVLLVHDDTLAAARRFAVQAQMLGVSSQALEGDRVLLFRRWLARRPEQVFGMTRHADRLLLADIARDMGYRELAWVQHREGRDRVVQGCRGISSLVDAAGPCWPEAFAEMAAGAGGKAAPLHADAEPAFSWVLRQRA